MSELFFKPKEKHAHIFLIGGAGDKKRYCLFGDYPLLGWGPTNIVGKYCDYFYEKLRIVLHPKKNFHVHYRSYDDYFRIEAELICLDHGHKPEDVYIILVGHSYGASTGYTLAKKYPKIIDSLFLVDPVGFGQKSWLNCWQNKTKYQPTKLKLHSFAGATLTSPVYKIVNIIAYLGGCWGRIRKFRNYLEENCNPYIEVLDKKICHNHFSKIMEAGLIDDNLEYHLINQVRNFIF